MSRKIIVHCILISFGFLLISTTVNANKFNSQKKYCDYNRLFNWSIKGSRFFYPILSYSSWLKERINLELAFVGQFAYVNNPPNFTLELTIASKSAFHAHNRIFHQQVPLPGPSFQINPCKSQTESFQEGWNCRQEAMIFLSELPGGRFTFQIAGQRFLGARPKQKLIMHLQFLHPYYSTWWAISLYGLVFLIILYGIRKYQIRRILENEEKKRLTEIDLLKTKLYTNISHEFRTPLTVILGMTKKLADDIGQEGGGKETLLPRVFESTDLILRNAGILLRLVNQMLDLAKLDSGQLSINWELGDVILFLQYLSESFNSYAATNEIQLTFYPEVKSLEMDFDSEKLQHIIFNLLSNALKFTPKGGKVIFHVNEIPVGSAHAGSLLQLKIFNSGIGIPEEHLTDIFDRFYQIDDTHRKNFEGSGIGLALTKDLVELMGGSILVTSKQGEGTEFTVQLPINKTAVPNPEVPLIEETVANSIIKRKELMTIVPLTDDLPLLLLIEDNFDVATYIRNCMNGQYRFLWAENGQIGIEKALKTIPDIIISDVMMPEKDGYEVTQFLKNDERTSHIPIILLTAKAEIKDKIAGLERGADAYLSKPFDKKELQVQTKKLVALRQQLQAFYVGGAISDFNKATGSERDPLYEKNVQIENAFLKKINEILDKHLSESYLEIPQLSRELHMSHSQLYRKIKALTGKSIAAYIRQYRLYQSRHLLQTTDLNISEIAYSVGFTDPSYFSRMFFEEFGISPTKVRK